MSTRKARMIRKADALFDHNPNYTFRQLMVSYRFWKKWLERNKDKCVLHVSNVELKK